MAIKELKEAIEKKKAIFGLRENLKNLKSKKKSKVYVVSDARPETFAKLKEKGIEAEMLKKKEDVCKELGLNFECEVFSII